MRLTRRELAGLAAAAPLAAQAPAVKPEPADAVQRAAGRLRRSAGVLAKTKLPMETEPAFSFKA